MSEKINTLTAFEKQTEHLVNYINQEISEYSEDIDEALDRIIEIQQSLIGYTVGIYNQFFLGEPNWNTCYVSKTKPAHAEDYDMIVDNGEKWSTPLILERVKKLFVWSDNSYNVSVAKLAVDHSNEGVEKIIVEKIIADHYRYEGCTFDNALEIEVKEDGYFGIVGSENGSDAFPGFDREFDQ